MTEELNFAKTPHRIVFNRVNGEHLWCVTKTDFDPEYDEELFIVREADMNPVKDEIVGGMIINADGTIEDNWQVVESASLPEMVMEKNLNAVAEQKITKKYPLVDQINILSKAIKLIGDKAGVELEDLDEMLSYIQLTLDTNKAQKAFYSDQPGIRYITDEQLAAEASRKMEGGIHEWIGPRPTTGGRVFGTS